MAFAIIIQLGIVVPGDWDWVKMLLYAPGIAGVVLAQLLDIVEDGNIHANRYVMEQCIMDGIPREKCNNAYEASNFSDAMMDVSYLLEKMADGRNLGEVVRSTPSIITKNAVLRVGASELLDAETPFEEVSEFQDENHRHLVERDILHQVILLLDIYEASLNDKDIMELKAIRMDLKKELQAIRTRADRGDKKAKAMLPDAQTALDNAALPKQDKCFTYGAKTAISFLRNRVYAKILLSSSTDFPEEAAGQDMDDAPAANSPAESRTRH